MAKYSITITDVTAEQIAAIDALLNGTEQPKKERKAADKVISVEKVEQQPTGDNNPMLTVEQLRALATPLMQRDKETKAAIIAKMKEYEVESLSRMPVEKYAGFVDFLKSL